MERGVQHSTLELGTINFVIGSNESFLLQWSCSPVLFKHCWRNRTHNLKKHYGEFSGGPDSVFLLLRGLGSISGWGNQATASHVEQSQKKKRKRKRKLSAFSWPVYEGTFPPVLLPCSSSSYAGDQQSCLWRTQSENPINYSKLLIWQKQKSRPGNQETSPWSPNTSPKFLRGANLLQFFKGENLL